MGRTENDPKCVKRCVSVNSCTMLFSPAGVPHVHWSFGYWTNFQHNGSKWFSASRKPPFHWHHYVNVSSQSLEAEQVIRSLWYSEGFCAIRDKRQCTNVSCEPSFYCVIYCSMAHDLYIIFLINLTAVETSVILLFLTPWELPWWLMWENQLLGEVRVDESASSFPVRMTLRQSFKFQVAWNTALDQISAQQQTDHFCFCLINLFAITWSII